MLRLDICEILVSIDLHIHTRAHVHIQIQQVFDRSIKYFQVSLHENLMFCMIFITVLYLMKDV